MLRSGTCCRNRKKLLSHLSQHWVGFLATNPVAENIEVFVLRIGGLIAARPVGVRTPICMPRKNGVQPLHAALERRAGAARLSPHAARHVHAYNRRAYGVQACQTGVQSLHACLKGVQSLHALRTGVQALHACRLT
ncbi:hypothetical protein PCANC_02972 [Puccinia coronata f. sp. avenae]|uniref:Uncharacterized protein n=1 Tax=Puccinia coronata f. sp. avenae TaxID=200324 RepID=A0A2N5W148_9BASI|nr:hypothetical protein PCANC_02972 [Puccinia coronata f. sp. avenae]